MFKVDWIPKLQYFNQILISQNKKICNFASLCCANFKQYFTDYWAR